MHRAASRRRWLHASLAVVLGVLLALGCANETVRQPATVAAVAPPLPMSVARTIKAGDSATVMLGPVGAADGAIGQVMVLGSYGVQRFEAPFENGVAKVPLSAELTQQAGLLTLFGSVDEYTGQTELTIVAGEPMTPLTVLVGVQSLVADGQATTTATIIPFDQYFNPVPDGTTFTIEAARPNSRYDVYQVETRHLVGWQLLSSTTTAGRTRVLARVVGGAGDWGTEVVTFDETPGEPLPFSISAESSRIPADGKRLVDLRTEQVRDRYGNVLPDGTLVTFLVADSDGTRRLVPSYTVDGRANMTIEASDRPGEATVTAVVAQVESDPIVIQFVEPR